MLFYQGGEEEGGEWHDLTRGKGQGKDQSSCLSADGSWGDGKNMGCMAKFLCKTKKMTLTSHVCDQRHGSTRVPGHDFLA